MEILNHDSQTSWSYQRTRKRDHLEFYFSGFIYVSFVSLCNRHSARYAVTFVLLISQPNCNSFIFCCFWCLIVNFLLYKYEHLEKLSNSCKVVKLGLYRSILHYLEKLCNSCMVVKLSNSLFLFVVYLRYLSLFCVDLWLHSLVGDWSDISARLQSFDVCLTVLDSASLPILCFAYLFVYLVLCPFLPLCGLMHFQFLFFLDIKFSIKVDLNILWL